MHALRLAEVLARRLSSDPSVVACFRDRLPDNEIDKYAIVLTREKLATKALATDADVDKTIAAKISEIWAEVRDGKWRVVYYDRGKGHPVYLSDAHLVSPPPLLSALANQLGRVGNGHARFEDVMLERVREHVEEPAKEAVVQPETEPPVMDGNESGQSQRIARNLGLRMPERQFCAFTRG